MFSLRYYTFSKRKKPVGCMHEVGSGDRLINILIVRRKKIMLASLIVCLAALVMGILTSFALAVIRTQMETTRHKRSYLALLVVLPCAMIVAAILLVLFKFQDTGLMGGILGCFLGAALGIQGTFIGKLKNKDE
jgi:energy-converting hydrogenase Eha subunit A